MKSAALGAAAILVGSGLASCGQSQAATALNSPASPVGTYTLSASSCGYEGKDTIAAGRGSITLANGLSTDAHFDFWRLDPGHAYAELDAHIQEEERRLRAGETMLGHPTFATLGGSYSVAARSNRSLAVPSASGTYGMVCIPWNSGPTGYFAAGPLTVSG